MIREKLVDGFENGLVAREGLIAHGRGESFDYLLGERTTESALNSINAASALFVLAEYPVLSVNGNTAALCGKEICELNMSLERSSIEINLFYRYREKRKIDCKRVKKTWSKKNIGCRTNQIQRNSRIGKQPTNS